ncbi:caspase family protein [Methylobacterium durans]|uniref:caspase family protein n=1 Tax=Methylobacterium durans TaxID=2202825 RepID=UPI002AFFCF07|nr:caspase family protein [Methylobacterium durans]MEA1835221.1 caspase family protein [Methylobacterium durans]
MSDLPFKLAAASSGNPDEDDHVMRLLRRRGCDRGEPAVRLFLYVLHLFMAACLLPLEASAEDFIGKGRRFALLIANIHYSDASPSLPSIRKDASLFADELRRNDFDVELKENLTRADAHNVLDSFYSKINAGSVTVFYFGGHAIQVDRQNYLLPVNAQIWSETEARREGINLDVVIMEMNRRGAQIKIAIIDAARSSPHERRFRASPSGLAPPDSPEGTLVLFTAAPSKVINDSGSEPSLFMSELLKELRVPRLPADDVFARTRMSVSRITNTERVPWMISSLTKEFYFSIPREKSLPLQSGVLPSPGKDAANSRIDDKQPSAGTLVGPNVPASPASGAALPSATMHRQERIPKSNPLEAVSPRPLTKAELQRKRELDAVITRDPSDEIALYKRGQLLAQRGEIVAAMEDFTRSIEINPINPEGFNNRCWVRALLGDLKDAIADCNEALKLRADFADALDSRGLANLKAGSFGAAESDYNAALRIDPSHSSAMYGRGIAKQRLGQKREGDEDVIRALSINPNLESIFASYGVR